MQEIEGLDQIAKNHINWNKRKCGTVFQIDETKINLFGSDGVYYIKRPVVKRNDKKISQMS